MPRTALELLRLLAEDAPSAQLEAHARQLAEVDPQGGEIARDLAMQVRGVIDARRRREAELSALVDTARDLASLRDPAGVLEAIVRRARTLLGTDVAYLTLFDPEVGDTFMRATDGSVSARFQTVRLPLGAGLGGLVAQTRRPYWTADYLADSRFQHTSDIDDAVSDEGLTAICGTPLLVEGNFVGVLFASNRSRRPFGHDEVALLGSLAALAAVSLVQSRAAAETREALSALSEAHRTVRHHTEGIERAAAAHDKFSQVVLEGGGVDDIAAVLGELLGGWVVVLDADGRRTAGYGEAPAEDAGTNTSAVLASAETGRLAHVDGHWAVVVKASGQRLGALVLGGRPELDSGDQRTVERAAVVTALVLLFRRQAAEAEQRVRTDLLADLLSRDGTLSRDGALGRDGTADERGLLERGRLLGVDLRQPHVVAVCRGGSPQQRRSLVMAASNALAGKGLTGEHLGDVVVLVPHQDASTLAVSLARRLVTTQPVTVGAAGPVLPLVELQAAQTEARRTVDALLALGQHGRGAAAADLGFAGLVVGDSPDIDGYLRQVLGSVLDYDARRGSDLVGTLEAYFAAGASPRHAATALHVHVNTVNQRLERVRVLLGEEWQTPDRTLELQLALRLRRLRGR